MRPNGRLHLTLLHCLKRKNEEKKETADCRTSSEEVSREIKDYENI